MENNQPEQVPQPVPLATTSKTNSPLSHFFIKLITTTVVISLAAIFTTSAIIFSLDDWEDYYYVSDGTCNIGVFDLKGPIMPVAEEGYLEVDPDMVRWFITQAESEPEIEGVLFVIDSPGGTPVAGEDVAALISNTTLPTIGLIRDSGTSAAYLAAAATDTIIASPFSDVGSIAITMSYVDYALQNEREGISFNQLSSGEFKDYMDPDRTLTEAERALLERDLAVWHDYFIDLVSKYRELDKNHVATLADGSSMPGSLAKEAGLVDLLGGRETARETFAATLEKDTDSIIFCD